MPRNTLPRCDGCRRAIRGRQIITCSTCSKKFHKNCLAQNTQNQVNNNFHQLYRLKICSNCMSTLNTPHFSASSLNNRFHLNVECAPTEDDSFEGIYCFENSRDCYFDTQDFEPLFEREQSSNIFFSLFLNIHGLNVMKHFVGLVALIESLPKKPHLIAINETCLKENEEGPFNNIDGYKFISNSRSVNIHGGVALYIQDNIKFTIRHDLKIMDEKIYESLFVDLKFNRRPVTVGTIYRVPDDRIANNNKFLHHLNNALRILHSKQTRCFLMGDMNFDLLDLDSQAEDLFKDEMFAYSFYPIINHPTRITDTSGTCIDHVWTNITDRPITSGIITDKIADHLPVFQLSDLGEISKKDHNHASLNPRDLIKLEEALSKIDINEAISNSGIDESLEVITTHIFQAIYSIKKSKKPNTKRDKWYDKALHKLKIKANRLHKKFLADRSDTNKRAYNQANNHFFFELYKKRDLFYKNLFIKYKNNMKSTWQVINKLLGKTKRSTGIALQCNNEIITEPIEVANRFNTYFSSIADDIRKEIPTETKNFKEYLQYRRTPPNSLYFHPTGVYEVRSTIRKLKPKASTGIDGISTTVLKSLPNNFIEAITNLFNQSMEQGFFPSKFKTAKVVPIYKRKGSRKNPENYRPISLLCSISKVLEKLIYKRVSKYLEKMNFFPNTQFGFRKKLSTSQAISLLVNLITKSMNQKKKTLGLFLDFSKAFDCIDHKILLHKLNKCGVRGQANKWFESYLSNRSQLVQVDGIISSNVCTLKHGTPQGSILGPLLFLIYISDLPACLNHSFPLFYADDTNLIMSATLCDELTTRGNEELKNIYDWVNSNKLTLNTDKTKAVIFRMINTYIPHNLPKLFLGDIEIKYEDSTKFLGVTFTKHLSWKSHMIAVKKKLRESIGACRKIKSQLSVSAMLSLYHSLVESHVRYGIMSWCHGNITMKNSIQRSCYNFLKMIFSTNNPDIIIQHMLNHKLLSVDQMLFFEVGLTMFKIHVKSFPECFNQFFSETTHIMSTRSNRFFNIDNPRIQLTKQSLNYKGNLVWQKIPNSVKYVRGIIPVQLVSFSLFKKNLREFILAEGPTAINFYLSEILYSDGE